MGGALSRADSRRGGSTATTDMLRLLLCTGTALLAAASATDVCSGQRCDTAACPCGCECGTPTDPGLCFAPSTTTASCEKSTKVKSTVLVTGATGRTGSKLYKNLVADGGFNVRAFVRDVNKARTILGCNKCDASEGIYVGNVSDDAALRTASLGARSVAIAVGSPYNSSTEETKAIEYVGVQKQVAALAQPANLATVGGPANLRVVLCSSMGTLDPTPPSHEGGFQLFWKLNAEAFIGASGLSYAVVKPCGLMSVAGNGQLLVGHDDTLLSTAPPVIARDDVARVMQAALAFVPAAAPAALRFDLCSKHGEPTTDLQALLRQSLYSWQRE